jgi:hypothetical protein
MLATMPTIRKRGDFNSACNHAIAYANRHSKGLQGAEEFLQRAGWGGETYGIEYVDCAGRELAYLNTGDTYNLTIGQEGEGEVFSTSWGGWLEDAENQHCQEEGETRCGYCGEFTPLDDSADWHATVCEHCGYFVDGSGKPAPRKVCEQCGEEDCECE